MKSSLRHRAEAELNLIPLIDILSVMVAFLLVYSTNVEVVQNAKGVEIPQSNADVQPKQSVVVMITKEQLFVQDELIATIDEIRESERSAHRAAARRARTSDARRHDASGAGRRAGDTRDHGAGGQVAAVRVVKKVMATCTAASYGKISLAVIEKEIVDRRCRPEQGLDVVAFASQSLTVPGRFHGS